ncbi:hypothetical protein FIBSPDRAFT_1046284 [Athelia psychrophila]|uniref:CxC1-like cysteine cluster associated with KDZ transposases domain-containing protein n=1 Tax=Athelia psychrophila TaxID=1759441 RepID=A0A166GW01_9AGAM|nr:hypothetical protein FIBSPDRAFT_1046284 [Fibularhizoctonia sp. CBS 109695]
MGPVRAGLSRRAKLTVGHAFSAPTTSSQGPHGREGRLAQAKAARSAEISMMDSAQRQDLLDSNHGSNQDTEMGDEDVEDEDDAYLHPPPGAEGAEHSHAGDGDIVWGLSEGMRRYNRRDTRIRSDRTLLTTNRWKKQMPFLVNAYLEWRNVPWSPQPANSDSLPEDVTPVPDRPETTSDDEEEVSDPSLPSDASPEDRDFAMHGVDTFDYSFYRFKRPANMIYTNEGLVRSGFIGSAPLYPTICISIRTLEDYRQTHRVCPRLSIQASVRKLCHVHNRPFHRHLSRQFSDAFDVYLEILHQVELQIAKTLGRDAEDWDVKNACPCCMYELEDEAPLEHRVLATMDGNNSLKLVDESYRRGIERIDNRTGRSRKWLSPAYVDQFKDEVASHNTRGATVEEEVGEDDEWLDEEMGVQDGRFTTQSEEVDNPMPGALPTPCIKRWKNAGPEGQKKMFSMFFITGVFVLLCRHGFLMLICDMIRSGELAKYPLAIVARILELLGENNVLGYDIGCAFSKTVASSTLGARAATQRLKFVVPSFHGHAHNRPCQLDFHPQYIPSLGIEDFETCERCFSLSNSIAPTTRLATKFHRQQAIEAHFEFQDEDKYAALSTFIYDNTKQSLDIIATNTPVIQRACLELGIGFSDFDMYLNDEREYLANLKMDPLANTLNLDYVKAIDNLAKFRAEADVAAAANTPSARDRAILRGAIGRDLTKLQRAQTTAFNRVSRAEDLLASLEANLGIVETWTPESADYIHTQTYVKNRKYLRAIDALEALVVQRLFELTKLNHSGTAYKQRTLIAKALQTRSRAIGTALTNYNRLAKTLDPPREDLDFQEILHYSSLAEFDLLRDTRNNVQTRIWAQPTYRLAMASYYKVQCAHKELERTNIEIVRLRTFIRDDGSGLATVLAHKWQLRSAINNIHLNRLDAVADLPGYTGSRHCGTRIGGAEVVLEEGDRRVTMTDDGDDDDIDDDSFQDNLNSLTDYVASLDL